jgi:hypothetical protein
MGYLLTVKHYTALLADRAVMFRLFSITDDLLKHKLLMASSVIFHHLLWVSVENFPGFFSKCLWYLVIFVAHTK